MHVRLAFLLLLSFLLLVDVSVILSPSLSFSRPLSSSSQSRYGCIFRRDNGVTFLRLPGHRSFDDGRKLTFMKLWLVIASKRIMSFACATRSFFSFILRNRPTNVSPTTPDY